MRAPFSISPKRRAAFDHVDRRGINPQAKRGPPAGAANALRLALRSAAHGESRARALHHMPEAARGLRPRGPSWEEPESRAGPPASAVDAMRLGLRRRAHWAGDARALYEMPEPTGSLTPGEPLGRTKQKLQAKRGRPREANAGRSCRAPGNNP
jgi:hypothetical protein